MEKTVSTIDSDNTKEYIYKKQKIKINTKTTLYRTCLLNTLKYYNKTSVTVLT